MKKIEIVKNVIREHINSLNSEELHLLSEDSDMARLEPLFRKILATLDKLDISIDYLSSAVTGMSVGSIGIQQAASGRLASPTVRRAKLVSQSESVQKINTKTLQERLGSMTPGEVLGQTFSFPVLVRTVNKRGKPDMERVTITGKVTEIVGFNRKNIRAMRNPLRPDNPVVLQLEDGELMRYLPGGEGDDREPITIADIAQNL
jgi:hypothetical protein